jgi:hypothetical protein
MIIPSMQILLISIAVLGGLLALDWVVGGIALKRNNAYAQPRPATATADTDRFETAA